MDHETETPEGPQAPTEPPTNRPSIPLGIRLLGTVGIAALIVALYAVVQATSSEEPPPPPDVGLGQTIRPLAGGDPPERGMPAPDFEIRTLGGPSFSLSRHLRQDGRPVLINMWAEWCFPCRQEMPALDAVSRNHPEVHFIGVVVMDREAPARQFVDEYQITYQIGLDEEGDVEDDYFVWVMPTTYLIGSDGIIVDRIFGPMDEDRLEQLVIDLATSGG